MWKLFARLAVLPSFAMLLLSIATPLRAETVSVDEAKKIASDAYLYAYPMLYNYKTLFQQAADPSFPGYVGGFNRFRHYSRGFTPADKDIVTPSNDTPYSWAWLDLRTEPMVVSVPASPDRYYVLQWFDLYTHILPTSARERPAPKRATISSLARTGRARHRRASRKCCGPRPRSSAL